MTTTTLKVLTELSECEETITISALSSPLLNADHKHRVTLFREGKECGTTIPLVLLAGLKLRFMEQMGLKDETSYVDQEVHLLLRKLLSDIHQLAKTQKDQDNILISKTFQEIIFRYVVWDTPLLIESENQLLENNKTNRSHTVSGNIHPSCSIPSYLCRWMLEKDGLNPSTPFRQINSYAKRVAGDVYDKLMAYDQKEWKKKASFSRRVQSRLMWQAFERSMSPETLSFPLLNTAKD